MDGKINQFVAVTGASVEDARVLLEACGGNLDLAVNMHLEGGGGGGATGNPSSSSAVSVEKSYEDLHGVRAPIPQTSGVLIEEDAPRRSLRSRRLPATVFDPFQDYSKVSSRIDDDGKLKSLADLFKPPFDIMFTGTFAELRMAGQSQRRWLLVNVQDSMEFASQVLNRDVWSHEAVKSIIAEHFLFWQIHKITDDGLKFKQLYNVNKFPYLAIVDPRTGEKMVDWDSITVSKLLSELSEFLQNNKFDADTAQTDDGIAEMSEEQQLEAAIRASLQCKPKRCNHEHNVDSDEFVSLSSGDEEEEEGVAVSEMEEGDGDSTDGLTKSELASKTGFTGEGLSLFSATNTTVANRTSSSSGIRRHFTVASEDNHRHSNTSSRKRKSSGDDNSSLPVKKMARSAVTNSHNVLQTEGTQSCELPNLKSSELTRNELRQEKGSVSSRRKGKQRLTTVSVEERLKLGELQRVDVSQVVIRLPDGVRIQKAFLCNSPIEDLFTYLTEKGIDTEEHEIMTHFPRRALWELDHSLSFREASLYPSVTVFVQD